MSVLRQHLVALPVVLPLMAATLLLLLGEKRRRHMSLVNLVATLLGLVVAATILLRVDGGGARGAIDVYLGANWEAPFGIVLVADRLSALMLVLVGIISLCAALYAEGAWARAGIYFYPLFQIQLMGLNGAFLTGDMFNLFVFFEVMLAASYGLQLHGSGWPRVRSGLRYIAVNLLASSLFLIGLAVIYGVMGTLSMADIASKLPAVPERDQGLLRAGASILAVAFLVKAAIWPLNAWLVPAYTATSAPVAALFALMTKVGIYTLLRLSTLFFSADASGFGRPVLLVGGLATLAFGAVGLMASYRLGRIAGFAVIVSSGTLLVAIGLRNPVITSAALFYLVSATLAASALFLLVELIDRIGFDASEQLPDVGFLPGEDTNLDDEEAPLVGRAVPVPMAVLGLAFVCSTVLVAGLPPLSGFVAKLSLLSALFDTGISPAGWVFGLFLLLSGLAATISMSRAGIRHLWSMGDRFPARMKRIEATSVLALLFACVLLTACAEPAMRYMGATAAGLHFPSPYIEAVLSTRARPGPTQSGAAEGSP